VASPFYFRFARGTVAYCYWCCYQAQLFFWFTQFDGRRFLVTIFSPRFAVGKRLGKSPGSFGWLSAGEVPFAGVFPFPCPLALCIIDSCCGIIRFKTLNVVATWAVFPASPSLPVPSFPNSISIRALPYFRRHCLRLLSFIFCLAYFGNICQQRLALNLSSNFLFCFCPCCSCHVMNVEICRSCAGGF